MASLVSILVYRHVFYLSLTGSRGCTTPKVLENIKSAWEEMQGDSDEKDYSNLDGYDELSEEYQVKVRNALEQGHVDSEDWKGVRSIAACIRC